MSKFSTDVISGKVKVQKMDHVYGNAEEKYTKATILYGKSGDNYLYSDAEGATAATEAKRIDKDTLLNLLLKGVLISYGDVYYQPLFFSESSGSVGVTFATAISASASAATVLYSKEYAAG